MPCVNANRAAFYVVIRACMVAAVVLSGLIFAPGTTVQAESLSAAVQQVIDSHPNVRSSAALLEASSERVRQAKSNFYPTVGLQAASNEAQDRQLGARLNRSTRNADAFLRWNLFRGLADYHSVRMAKSDKEAANEDLADAHERVALQVAASYLDVLRLRRRLVVAEAYVEQTARLVADVRKLVAAGKTPPSDIDQVDVGLIEGQWEVAQLRGELAGAEQGYRLLTGALPEALHEPGLETAMDTISQDDMLSQVLVTNPRIRASQARAAARTEEVGVAGSALFPRLDIELRKRLLSDIKPDPVIESRESGQVSLNYEMPLGGGSFSTKREAQARMSAAFADMDQAILEAQTSSTQLWNVWSEARQIAATLARRAQASDKVVSAYDQQFNAGRRSLQDLIVIRDEYRRAQADVIDNGNAQGLGAAQILALMGRLRASLHIVSTPAAGIEDE
jgi:outer membrane protein, adhesin transport system